MKLRRLATGDSWANESETERSSLDPGEIALSCAIGEWRKVSTSDSSIWNFQGWIFCKMLDGLLESERINLTRFALSNKFRNEANHKDRKTLWIAFHIQIRDHNVKVATNKFDSEFQNSNFNLPRKCWWGIVVADYKTHTNRTGLIRHPPDQVRSFSLELKQKPSSTQPANQFSNALIWSYKWSI